MISRKNKILVHAVLWLILLVSTGLEVIPSIGKYSSGLIAGDYFIYLVSHVITFYIFYLSVSGKVIRNHKPVLTVIAGIFTVLLISALTAYIYDLLISGNILDLEGKQFWYSFGRLFFGILYSQILYAVAGTLLKLVLLWYENTIKQKEAEKKNITSELALLRSQINPRFLSFSLGHIRSLIYKQPEKAIYSIENLSEIMSYMLYETSADLVPLENEINYISNYINLQKVRFAAGYIDLQVSGDTAGIKVPPLLFMPFLERTFRSSAESSPGIPGIAIKLYFNGAKLIFESEYYKSNNTESIIEEDTLSINGIKRFLDLQLAGKYELETSFGINKSVLKLVLNLQ